MRGGEMRNMLPKLNKAWGSKMILEHSGLKDTNCDFFLFFPNPRLLKQFTERFPH